MMKMGDLKNGAREAVVNCLKLSKGERIVIITDLETLEISVSLLNEAKNITDKIKFFIVEDFQARPLNVLPEDIVNALNSSQVGILAMQGREGELENFRRPLLSLINKSGIRFANMINISQSIMEEGMNARYKEIKKFSKKVFDIVKDSKQITVKTCEGTDLNVEFDPSIKWVLSDGDINPGDWKNLPDGEVFTCPSNVNGTAVIDGVLGDHFSKKFGLLNNFPLFLKIRDSFVVEAKCKNKNLEADFLAKLKTDENASRIGEFAIGTNLFIKELIGNMIQDEKFPGVHIAFGNGYPEKTGSNCHSKIHIDGVIRNPEVIVDGQTIMRNGGFVI